MMKLDRILSNPMIPRHTLGMRSMGHSSNLAGLIQANFMPEPLLTRRAWVNQWY